VLVFTAAKMALNDWIHVSARVSVLVIAAVLLTTILASMRPPTRSARSGHST
jgi:hypothetical protein